MMPDGISPDMTRANDTGGIPRVNGAQQLSGMTGPTRSLEESAVSARQANAATELQGRISLAQVLADGNIPGASQTFHLERTVKVAHGADFTAQAAAYGTGEVPGFKGRRVSRKHE